MDKKITIETLSDFLKIPFSKLKSTKLSNFNGKFFDELYQNALRIERGEVNHKEIEKDDIDLENINDDNYSENIQMMHNPLYQNDNNKIINNRSVSDNFENEKNNNYEKNNNQNKEKLRNKEIKKNMNNNNIKNNQINNNNMRINKNNEINRNQNMNINRNNNNNNNNNIVPSQGLSLHKVTFQIEYATIYGEEIAISGSGNSLGNWDQNKVFKLKWTNGNIWKGSISLNEYNFRNFEFKFVLLSNNKIKTWENGGNNIVNFNNIYQVVLKNRKGKFSKYDYEYSNDELILKCKWS